MRKKCGNPYYNKMKHENISGKGLRPYNKVLYGSGIFSFLKMVFKPVARLFMKSVVPLGKSAVKGAVNLAKKQAPKLIKKAGEKAIEEGKKAIVDEGSKFVLNKVKDLGRNIVMGKKQRQRTSV